MHEMGIAINIIDVVKRGAARSGVSKVDMVRVSVGELSGAVPRYLKNSWPVVCQGTVCEDSELVIEQVEAIGECQDCGENYRITENLREEVPYCPKCGSKKWILLRGHDVTVKEIGVSES